MCSVLFVPEAGCRIAYRTYKHNRTALYIVDKFGSVKDFFFGLRGKEERRCQLQDVLTELKVMTLFIVRDG